MRALSPLFAVVILIPVAGLVALVVFRTADTREVATHAFQGEI